MEQDLFGAVFAVVPEKCHTHIATTAVQRGNLSTVDQAGSKPKFCSGKVK